MSALKKEEEEEEEEDTLFDPKCTMHHISYTKLDIKQYKSTHMDGHMSINILHGYTNNNNNNILWGR